MDTKPYEFYRLDSIYKVSNLDTLPSDNCWYLVCRNYNDFVRTIQQIQNIPVPMHVLERLPGCMVGIRPSDYNMRDSSDGWLFWAHNYTTCLDLFSKIAVKLVPVKGSLVFIPDSTESIEHKEYNLNTIENNLLCHKEITNDTFI